MPGPVPEGAQHPGLRRVVVVAGVAEEDQRRLLGHLVEVTVVEHLEGVAVVGVAVDPHHVGFGVDAVDRLGDVVGALEEPGDLVDPVDEHPGADLRELAGHRVDELQREAGEARHRAGDVGDDHDLGFRRVRMTELRLRGDAAVGQGRPDGLAEVEVATVAASAPLRQPRGQGPGQRVDGPLEREHLLAGGVHEVDVFGERLAQGAGHRLDAPVGDETAADLGFDELAQHPESSLVLLGLEPRREVVVGDVAFFLGSADEPRREVVQVELPQRPVQVVGAPDGASRFHARELGDRGGGEAAQLVAVHVHQRVEEHLRELLAGELASASPAAAGFADHLGPLVGVGVVGVDTGAVQREVDVEDGLERGPVPVMLDEGGTERGSEQVPVGDVDVLDGAHGVEVLGHRHREAGAAQLVDEALEDVEHRLRWRRRRAPAPCGPWRCRTGT